ncbi:MAG TPA: DUF5675 family protein [Bacteroidia bacterium]|nr:DUF5675 family protein [Bacteroidia bacterium]
MKAIISRTYKTAQTEGVFQLKDNDGVVKFACHSLELPYLNNQKKISCIPEGVYQVKKITSPSQGLCFSIQNVPQRDHILIHKGNYAGSDNPNTGHPDILGCILLGTSLADISKDGIAEIINSKATMNKLLDLVDEFELTITKDGK